MTTAIILIVSGVLIGAGISIIWRDVRARRRRAFCRSATCVQPRLPSEAEITISIDPQPAVGAGDADFERDAGAAPAPEVVAPSPPPATARWARAIAPRRAASRSSRSGRTCSRRSPPASTRSTPCWRPAPVAAPTGRAVLELQEPRLRRLPSPAAGRRERGVAAARASPATGACTPASRRTRTTERRSMRGARAGRGS